MPAKKEAVRTSKKQSVPATEWENVLKSLPNSILVEEQRRRLAVQKKVTEIPDKLLNAEITRREEEFRNRPIQWID